VRAGAEVLPASGTLLVLAGDTPLLKPETLKALVDGHSGLCTVLTAVLPDDEIATNAYGRIVRGADGAVQRIVEVANATGAEKQLAEVNTGVYAFDARWLFEEVVPSLKPHPPKDEYYLTDAIEAAAAAGSLSALIHEDLDEVVGVNDRSALARCERVLRARINERWMLAGVTLQDPVGTYIDAEVTLDRDVTVGPGAILRGATRVASGARIDARAVVTDSVLAEGASVGAHAVVERCELGPGAAILAGSVCAEAVLHANASAGPMARLRTGAVLGESSKVGNFVEVKKATLGRGAKASHLTYLGDAAIGAGANIGAGTITCNYDGFGKNHTHIGAGAFIGSNTALIAPVSVGDGAIVGAGSVIARDVPDDSLGVTRADQKNREGIAPRLRDRYRARAEKKKREG